MLEITQWGNLRLLSGNSVFETCKNLLINTRDQPNLKDTTDLSYMFYDCDSFNSDLSKWDVSTITNMECMFHKCKEFTSDLSKWDVSNVTNMECIFDGCKSFNSNLHVTPSSVLVSLNDAG